MELQELKQTIDGMVETTSGFADRLKSMDDLGNRLTGIETMLNRPGNAGANGNDQTKATKTMVNFLLTGTGLEVKDMNIGSNPDGGHAVPEEIDRMVQNQLIEISGMRAISQVTRTGSSDFKKLIGVRGTTSGWSDESSDRTETNTPQLAPVVPTMGELYAYPSASRWVFEDVFFDLESWLRENVADEFAFREGAAFITGDGVDKPTGFLHGTPTDEADDARAFGDLQYVPTGVSGSFGVDAFNNLMDLRTSLRPSYRNGATWLMNSNTAGVISKIKDADGRPIWNSNVAMGQPATLFGAPVAEFEDMPDIAADSFPIAFGNFQRGYLITDRGPLTVIRDEVTKPGWIKLYVAKRVGGKVSDSNAIKLLKFSVD